MSQQQMLLRFDSDSGAWQRVAAKEFLVPGQQLVALPTYRPEITLSAGVNLQLLGGTKIELLSSDWQGVAGVKVLYGRMFIMPLAQPGTRLRLCVDDRAGMLTFTDAESIAAVEVTPLLAPGRNPETEPAPPAVDLYATSGEILWDAASEQQTVNVAAGRCLVVDKEAGAAEVGQRELPKWITSEVVGPLDRRASSRLEQEFRADCPAGLGLKELTDHRQEEVRRLAVRCLGHIGQFDAMVAVLNEPDHKLDWPDYYVEQLRQAVARGPKVAAAVRQAIQRQYGEEAAAFGGRPDTEEQPGQEAAALYRMLWGYTPEDLKGGQAKTLVEHLNDETLALRVVSFWNLKKTTGWGLYYDPEKTAAKRQRAIQEWRQRLASGEIFKKAAEKEAERKKRPAVAHPPPAEDGQKQP